jgi:Flp pilus assembly protein TadD
MRLRAITALWAVLGMGCAPRMRTASTPPPPAGAQQTAFERQIRNAHDAGDGDYQLRALRDKVAGAPDDISARLALAAAYRERGYPDISLEICRLAVARFPESGEAQLALVRSLRDLNHRGDAITSLEVFVAAHPQSDAKYYSWLGILRDESGQWTAGEPSHRKAIELAPADDYLHNNLGYNLLLQKKHTEAAAEFREALRLNPASQTARNNLGMALAAQDSREALASLQSTTDPASAHNNLAAVLIEKGNYTEARKELELALGYNKAHPAALKNMELVSRLDGHPATLPTRQEISRWERWKTGFVHLFVGPLDDTRTHTQ